MEKSKSGLNGEREPSRSGSSNKKSCKFIKILSIIVVAVLILFTAVAVYVNGYSGVFPNTYVSETKVSGMSEAEIMNYLSKTYTEDKIKGEIITLKCKTNSLDINIDEFDVKFDNVALAESVLSSGKNGNVISNTVSFVKRLFSPEVIKPVLVYNTGLLNEKFDAVTDGFETEPVGHTFEIGEDSVTIHAPSDGVKADRKSATEEFEKRIYEMTFETLELIPVAVSPTPLDFDEFYKWLTSDARDAYYEKVDGKVIIHESKPKCEVDRTTVENALSTLESTSESKVTISATVTQPESTTQKMTEILYKDVLGSYSTNFGASSASRANNVRLAASRIDGTELMPGEEFSYDKTILPRTTANGYMSAGVYVGNKVESGLGGGICQPSSTLYAAALYANLEILERHNHSLPVSYLPAGLDATIAEGYLDLRIRNSSDYPVKISAITQGGVITFKILGYNPDNISVDVLRSFSGGAHHVTRVVKQNGVEIKRESMTSSVYGTPEKDEEEKKPEEEPEEEGTTPDGTAPTEPSGETADTPDSPTTETPVPTPEPTPAPSPTPTPEPTPVAPPTDVSGSTTDLEQ